jgi:hypothetical protein
MCSSSVLKRLAKITGFVALGAVLLGSFSPAIASDENSPAVLTSHLPWLAPTGHRQPRAVDLPQEGVSSEYDRRQEPSDAELDRKLIICRGC